MKKWFLILALLVVVVAAMATSRRSFVQPVVVTSTAQEDGWLFGVVTETNNAPFRVGFIGAGTRTIDWGDGSADMVTNGNVTVEYVYPTAASNVMRISGSFTRIYFVSLLGNHRLKRIIRLETGCPDVNSFFQTFQGCKGLVGDIPSVGTLTNITSLANAFYDCWSLPGPAPALSNLTLLTSLANAFGNCFALTGTVPEINNLTNLTTLLSAWDSCAAITGNIPTMTSLTKLTTINRAFYACRSLTNNTRTVSEIFGAGSRSNLTTSANCFYNVFGLQGAGADFTNLTFNASYTIGPYSTNSSYRTFYNCTNLTDFADLTSDWK